MYVHIALLGMNVLCVCIEITYAYMLYIHILIYSTSSYVWRRYPMFHIVPGMPVFWFSVAQSMVHRLVPVDKPCVTGLGQISMEIENKPLDA